ncbi:sensor histidine kinase [Tardiphaga sp.]|uniref:sensor histidine kinase n=1 Tax=Tardiphaga sp. TaxID=1926292 RepID=UPI00352BC350
MRLLGSLLFRLALLYALVFSASLALLITGYYLVSVHRPIETVKGRIRGEANSLMQRFGSAASPGLRGALEARATSAQDRTPYHVLLSPNGEVLAKNLPSWPRYEGKRWVSIEADSYYNGEDNDHMALLLDEQLADGSRLMIGRDVEDLRQREGTIFGAAGWLIIGGVLFGVVGGVIMSRTIGKRIDSINVTARRVMAGDLFERIPTYGSQDDFDSLAETLNLMLGRIQALLDAIRRVSDSVAHELRTPLTRLHTDLSELSASLPSEARALVDNAVSEAENVISLFDAVLRIGRIESIRGNVELAKVDVSQLLIDVVEIFGPSAEEKGIGLEVTITDGLYVIGNSNLLFQAIGNILDNAIKFAPADGRVELAGGQEGGEVQLCVADNGPGIPTAYRQEVFERFFRLPETAEVQGLGLGLSFVKAVAEAHRSIVRLEDANPGLRVRWSFLAAPTGQPPAVP